MNTATAMTVDQILEAAGVNPEACDDALRLYFKQTPLTVLQDRAELLLTAVTSEPDFYQSYGALSGTGNATAMGGIAPLGVAYDGMLSLCD